MKKHIIWSNMNLNLDDWRGGVIEHAEINGLPVRPDDENWLTEGMYSLNDSYFEDELINLNVQLPESIIAIADLGFWNGRATGYKNLGSNLNDCLRVEMRGCDYREYFVDGYGNFRMTAVHHDGTHYLHFRMWKPGLSERQKDILRDAVFEGKASSQMISRYTKPLGPYVAKVYGWKVRGAM